MSNEKYISLVDIARSTYWEPGIEVRANVINDALIRAGFSTDNEAERIRFCSLVKEEYYRIQQDDVADLGKYFGEARNSMNGSASIEEIIEEAHRLKMNDEERDADY